MYLTGAKELNDFTHKNISEAFLHGRQVRNWKPSTFGTYHKTLKVFFKWCIDNNYWSKENPMVGIVCPKLGEPIPRFVSEKDSLRLLEYINNYPYAQEFIKARNYAIIATFLYSGIRRSELVNLQMVDIDVDGQSIFVRRGKGSKDRIIPMSHSLAQTLLRYMKERKKLKKTCPEFFTSFKRNQGLSEVGLKYITDSMRSMSGINFSPHRLRHTFGTLMAEGGCNIYMLSKMMGHSSIESTLIYIAATARFQRNEMLKHPLNITAHPLDARV